MFFITTSKTTKLPYNVNDLEPLANVIQSKLLLFVKGDSPWKTLNDLLDYGRKNPGKIRWATVGQRHLFHIDTLSLFKKAGVETVHISYPGTPEMMSALWRGAYRCRGYGLCRCQRPDEGRGSRALVTFNSRRYGDLQDIPTALELGFPDSS